jgi:hypothetical protein
LRERHGVRGHWNLIILSPAISEPFNILLLLFYTDLLSSVDDHFVEDASRSPNNTESPYDVPEIEANLYYAGLFGPSGGGPKLVYRTSRERKKFIPPTGPEAYPRLMRLVGVPASHKLGEELGNNRLWDIVREEVRDVLDTQQSVD